MNRTDDYAHEERYLRWLYSHIGSLEDLNPNRSSWLVAETLHRLTFFPHIPNDENRAFDGVALREMWGEPGWELLTDDCSYLELMIGLAQRLNFQVERGSAEDGSGVGSWFWIIAKNARLDISDERFLKNPERAVYKIERVVELINTRSYLPNGQGGFFPVANPSTDFASLELWYQMQEYLSTYI